MNDFYPHNRLSGVSTAACLWGPTIQLLNKYSALLNSRRVFEIGSGIGGFARNLQGLGFDITGVEPSPEGVTIAHSIAPSTKIELGSCYDDLVSKFGKFPIIVSMEVIEHLYYPRKFVSCIDNLLEDSGVAIISTPYHGYLKNVAIAVFGMSDTHYSPLCDHGHIKFWSINTLTKLFSEQGFELVDQNRVGRIPPFAKSIIAVFRRDRSRTNGNVTSS